MTKLVSDITKSQADDASRAMERAVPEWTGSSTLDALQELVDVAALMPAEVAHRAGLSTSELHALRHLMGTPMGPVDLARALGVTSAAASGVVDRLVSHGHAERRPHPQDGRRTQVVITDGGREETFGMLAPMFRALAALDGSLTPTEHEVVGRYLRGATAAMKELVR